MFNMLACSCLFKQAAMQVHIFNLRLHAAILNQLYSHISKFSQFINLLAAIHHC